MLLYYYQAGKCFKINYNACKKSIFIWLTMPKLCFPTCQIPQRSNSSPTLFPWSPLCTSEGSAQWQSSPTSPTSLKKSCKNSLKMELETLEDIFDFLSDKYHCCGEHKSGRQSFKEIHQQSQLFFPRFFLSAGQHKPHFQTEGTSWQTGDYPNISIIPIFSCPVWN